MRIRIPPEYLFAALTFAGAGMLEIVPDKHVFAWVLIGVGALILVSGLRIDGWQIKFNRYQSWRSRVSAWGPWLLIVGGPLAGLLWLHFRSPVGTIEWDFQKHGYALRLEWVLERRGEPLKFYVPGFLFLGKN